MDLEMIQAKNVCLVTDRNVEKLPIMTVALDSLERSKINYSVFNKVRVEPSNDSWQEAITFAKNGKNGQPFDAYLAIGGGSVMDTAKAANLYATFPDAELLDFVNAPIGKGKVVPGPIKPLIAVTTTSGTGSETTGTAIFDYKPLKSKTGISSRQLRPALGIVDSDVCVHIPRNVAAYSGFDVLCHAIESYTAIPYTERGPAPANPALRPAYQGQNPVSDIWSLHALRIVAKYLKRSIDDAHDTEARTAMHMAGSYAGVGFGNAGCHLCHGMSYPISGMVRNFQAKDYNPDHPIIPHGLSVIITAPAVFKFTAPACPERHLEVAQILGADTTNARLEDAGLIVSDALRKFMKSVNVENGLQAFGYNSGDIAALVKGTLPQQRVTKLSPRTAAEEDLTSIFADSMTIY